MATSITPMSVRVPSPLREQLAQRAAAEGRSVSNMMVVLLTDALAEHSLPRAERLVIRKLLDAYEEAEKTQ